MPNQTLIDSSFLYAIYNGDDEHHVAARNFVKGNRLIAIVPDVILPELAYLFMRDIGHHAVIRFLEQFAATQSELQALTMADIQRAQEIMATYAEAEFDVVDSCIMALAERLRIIQICTFDQRDFRIFRPKHCPYLELLP